MAFTDYFSSQHPRSYTRIASLRVVTELRATSGQNPAAQDSFQTLPGHTRARAVNRQDSLTYDRADEAVQKSRAPLGAVASPSSQTNAGRFRYRRSVKCLYPSLNCRN